MDTMIDLRTSGYRLPAEWETQDAVWFSWPVSTHIWPAKRTEVWNKFAEIICRASQFEEVRINADDSAHAEIEKCLSRNGCDLKRIQLYPHATNDVWCRDHGPIFLRHEATGRVLVANWMFNAWGGKFEPWNLDNEVPGKIASSLGLPSRRMPFILEGGAIESDGEGNLLTTRSVILNLNREPNGLSEAEATERLCRGLGVQRVIWLDDGLPNDDTDGHIDNLARFYAPGKVIAVRDKDLPVLENNYRVLEEIFGEVRALPRPQTDGPPRSYANFLILNGGVLVPVFGQPSDDEALDILQECFPAREIVGIDCNLLLEEGGAIHCLSMQQPSPWN